MKNNSAFSPKSRLYVWRVYVDGREVMKCEMVSTGSTAARRTRKAQARNERIFSPLGHIVFGRLTSVPFQP